MPFCTLFPLHFYVFLVLKAILGIPSVYVEGIFSGKNVLKIYGSSKKNVFWMYTVNKKLCLFKILRQFTCLLSCLVSCMFRTKSQYNLYRILLVFLSLTVCSYFQLPLFWQVLDLVVIINADIMIRYNLQVQQCESNLFNSIMA